MYNHPQVLPCIKSIYRSLKNRRRPIRQDYATFLEECSEIKIKKRRSGALLGTWERFMLETPFS